MGEWKVTVKKAQSSEWVKGDKELNKAINDAYGEIFGGSIDKAVTAVLKLDPALKKTRKLYSVCDKRLKDKSLKGEDRKHVEDIRRVAYVTGMDIKKLQKAVKGYSLA